MTFTTTPPTTPGFYAWKIDNKDPFTSVREIFNPCSDVLIDRGSDLQPKDVGGVWCRLVPAEEVEKAYKEGAHHSMLLRAEIDYEWNHSRAKQVAEGKI